MKYSLILKNNLALDKISNITPISGEIKVDSVGSICMSQVKDVNVDIDTSTDKSKDGSNQIVVSNNNRFNE